MEVGWRDTERVGNRNCSHDVIYERTIIKKEEKILFRVNFSFAFFFFFETDFKNVILLLMPSES